jgi:hypothetical protein
MLYLHNVSMLILLSPYILCAELSTIWVGTVYIDRYISPLGLTRIIISTDEHDTITLTLE